MHRKSGGLGTRLGCRWFHCFLLWLRFFLLYLIKKQKSEFSGQVSLLLCGGRPSSDFHTMSWSCEWTVQPAYSSLQNYFQACNWGLVIEPGIRLPPALQWTLHNNYMLIMSSKPRNYVKVTRPFRHCFCTLPHASFVELYLQELYVWELYLKRTWDFFPVGDCFHRQEEGWKHNAQQEGERSSHLPGMPKKALTIR